MPHGKVGWASSGHSRMEVNEWIMSRLGVEVLYHLCAMSWKLSLLQFLRWHCRCICESWYPILHRTCLCYLNPRPSPLYLCLCDTLCPKSPVPISLWASGPGAVRSPLSPVPFMRNLKEYTTLCPLCIVREGIHMWLHKWVRLVGCTSESSTSCDWCSCGKMMKSW